MHTARQFFFNNLRQEKEALCTLFGNSGYNTLPRLKKKIKSQLNQKTDFIRFS